MKTEKFSSRLHQTIDPLIKKKIDEKVQKALNSGNNTGKINITIDFADEMVDAIFKEIEHAKENISVQLGKDLLERRNDIKEFIGRLNQRWGSAFDNLEFSVMLSRDIAYNIMSEYKKGDKIDIKLHCLNLIHSRALLKSREILTLLKNGFPDGAMSLWRSLFELMVFAAILNDNSDEIAVRFYEYQIIEQYKLAKEALNIGFPHISDEEFNSIENEYLALKNKYESHFSDLHENYGWLPKEVIAQKLGKAGRVTFSKLIKLVNFENFKPHFKWASSMLHSEINIMINNIGVYSGLIFLSGRTNYGLADPGMYCGKALLFITSTFLQEAGKLIDYLPELVILQEIVQGSEDLFSAIQFWIEEQEGEGQNINNPS